jgi:hypothetical protein
VGVNGFDGSCVTSAACPLRRRFCGKARATKGRFWSGVGPNFSGPLPCPAVSKMVWKNLHEEKAVLREMKCV